MPKRKDISALMILVLENLVKTHMSEFTKAMIRMMP